MSDAMAFLSIINTFTSTIGKVTLLQVHMYVVFCCFGNKDDNKWGDRFRNHMWKVLLRKRRMRIVYIYYGISLTGA